MGRAPCCDKANVKRGPWSPEEDAKLKSYIENHGTGGNWIALPQKIGLKRCGKSCRLRWLNYLRPNIKHGGFTEEEDNLICNLYITIGSRWSIIAAQLPGRTDNDIKNYWNTRLKKKLIGKQRRSNKKQQSQTSNKRQQFMYNQLQQQQQMPIFVETQPTNPMANISMMMPPLEAAPFPCNRLQTTCPDTFHNYYTCDAPSTMINSSAASTSTSFVEGTTTSNTWLQPVGGDFRAFYDEINEMDGVVENLFDISCVVYPPALSNYEAFQRKTLQNWAFLDQPRILGYTE